MPEPKPDPVAALRRECAEVMRLDAEATPGPWEFSGPGSLTLQRPATFVRRGQNRIDGALVAYYRVSAPRLARVLPALLDLYEAAMVAAVDDSTLDGVLERARAAMEEPHA